jgi:hypothetical protein
MGFFNAGDMNWRPKYLHVEDLDEPEEGLRRPRRGRQDWIDSNEEGDYAFADCSYDRALLDQHRSRKGLKPGRPLTYEERRVVELLDDLDAARRKAHDAVLAVMTYMSRKGALQLTFERFLKAGGVTGDDFEAMIQSGFDLPAVMHRGAIRLVVNNRPAKSKIKRRMLDRAKMKLNRRR